MRAKAHFSREFLNQLASKMWRTWNHATHVKNDPAILARKMEERSERMVARDGIMARRMDDAYKNGDSSSVRRWSRAENSIRQIATDNYQHCWTEIWVGLR